MDTTNKRLDDTKNMGALDIAMSQQSPTIADIQSVDLVYYDSDFEKYCYQFCQERDIDCLPEIGFSNTYYERNIEEEGFNQQTISDDRRLDAATFLFHPSLLERFTSHAVQFVYANGAMTGVVHFSDYNKDFVTTYLYGQIARYERDLRELAKVCGLTNEDMADHFQKMAEKAHKNDKEKLRSDFEAKKEAFERKQEDLRKQDEFISFYLMDLIGLANRHKVIRLDDRVNQLRKLIMHAGVLVEMDDAHTPDFIYKIDSFAYFFERVLILLKDGQRIRNRLTIKRKLHQIAFESWGTERNGG